MIPGFKVHALDATGAGDVFNGALAVALAEGRPLLEAARFGSAAAAISVTRFGAQPSAPTRREIASRARHGKGSATDMIKHRFSHSAATLALIVSLGALALFNGGCNKSGDTSDKASVRDKPTVALVMKSLANEFFATMAEGARRHQAANAATYDLAVNGIKNETDLAEQVNLVEQMIAQQVNAIVIAPADSRALVAVLKRARDAGILVVNIDNKLDPGVLRGGSPRALRRPGQSCRRSHGRRRARETTARGATRWPSSKASRPPSTASNAGWVSRTPCPLQACTS